MLDSNQYKYTKPPCAQQKPKISHMKHKTKNKRRESTKKVTFIFNLEIKHNSMSAIKYQKRITYTNHKGNVLGI